jgi:hypothetical protein
VEVPDDFGFAALALLVVLFLGLPFGLGASSCNTLQSVLAGDFAIIFLHIALPSAAAENHTFVWGPVNAQYSPVNWDART